ncbi:MAG: hypothetical protein GY728_10045, partial [Phycisphaeraceae bacterium]|nr:hypothetical protein [Phycisphaeraceae bacterium]
PNDFALNGAHGDDVWLMKVDAEGIAYFVEHVEFGGAANGESFGRWPNAEGGLYPMLSRTFDAEPGYENAGPRIGPLVISEVHFNSSEPAGADDLEFIEIYNPTDETVNLTGWRIRKGIDYDFDPGTSLGAKQTLVVISFNPDNPENASRVATFRTTHNIGASVTLVGGYGDKLENGGEKVQLQRPDSPPMDEPTYTPHLVEDEVIYDEASPWPTSADGAGDSLNRAWADRWGNSSSSWTATGPTPGTFPFTSPLVGDASGDGIVGDIDLNLVLSNLGAVGVGLAYDLDGDGDVDENDVRLVTLNFGAVAPVAVAASLTDVPFGPVVSTADVGILAGSLLAVPVGPVAYEAANALFRDNRLFVGPMLGPSPSESRVLIHPARTSRVSNRTDETSALAT